MGGHRSAGMGVGVDARVRDGGCACVSYEGAGEGFPRWLGCGLRVSWRAASIRRSRKYSTADDHGGREKFDEDLCRAVAVAVLGEHARVRVVEFPDDRSSMDALTSDAVDMVPTLSDDFTHSVGTHLEFTRPVLWDGVGFLVLGSSPVTRVRQLSGKKICFIAETTVEESVRSWFAREYLDFVPFPFQEEGEMEAAFATETAVRWLEIARGWRGRGH